MHFDQSLRTGPQKQSFGVSPLQHHRRHWSRRFYTIVVILCLTSLLFIDISGNVSTASAAATTIVTKLPIVGATNTLQQFLRQGNTYKSFDGIHVLSGSQSTTAQSTSAKTTQARLPSAEPPTMKDARVIIASTYVTAPHAPSTSPSSIAKSSAAVTPAIHLSGSDSGGMRFEVSIPTGALDFSAAKTPTGAAPIGNLTITLTQLRGHYITATTDLASYQITITDTTGQMVQNVKLLTNITYIFHYRATELKDLDLNASQLSLRLDSIPSASQSQAATHGTTHNILTDGDTTSATATSAIAGTSTTFQNNVATSTLTASSSVLIASASVTAGTGAIQNPPKARFASVQGNSGQLSYSYPLTVAPGPSGTTPTLSLNYSSASTNARHSPTSPAGLAGEGWSLSMGEITASQVTQSSGTTTIYAMSGVDGISDQLIPNSGNPSSGTQDYQTEHMSYFRIKRVDAGTGSATGQHYFLVWDKDGNEYEFGNTTDSLQYYINSSTIQINYAYALDKVILADAGSGYRTINITYVQDKENGTVSDSNSTRYTWIRDYSLKRITYGTTSNGNTTLAGTVDFFYNGPTAYTDSNNNITYVTQYTSAYEAACNAPSTNLQRCDDPLDRNNGTEYKDPDVMSTLELTGIKSYVGSDTSGALDFSYAMTYTDTAFSQCSNTASVATTISNYYCAGDHLLTKIVPTVYQAGTGHALPGMDFSYTSRRTNRYDDSSQDYHMSASWKYLVAYHDLSSGAGATSVTWHTAWNNSNGTPYEAGDNRTDALFCEWHASTDCVSGNPFYPYDNKMWTEQVVTQIVSQGKDSSASSLGTSTMNYDYWLADTQGSCPADSQGNSACVGYGWMPDSGDTSTYTNYYNGHFRGFGTVLITSASGDMTMNKYATTYGWASPMTLAKNYLSGNLLSSETFTGGSADCTRLLTQTLYHYAGELLPSPWCTSNPFSSTPASCSITYVKSPYTACEPVLLSTRTTDWEGGTGIAGPYTQHDFTYDDYSSSSGLGSFYAAPATGSYHNLQKEVITSSNASSSTKKWTYYTTNSTVNNHVYYVINKVAHSEVDDSNSVVYQCTDTMYDEGATSTIPMPFAGWPTTVKTYSTCGDSSTAITSYAGYDLDGNIITSVDGVGAANLTLYSTGGCTVTAPPYLSTKWTAGRYTTCKTYNPVNSLLTLSKNALNQSSTTSYDFTQGLLPTSVVDPNSQTTNTVYSYDTSGNAIVELTQPGETGSYTLKSMVVSNCTDSSSTPCVEVDTNNSLYSSAISRTFNDSMGREVETQTPGPGSAYTTVTFTIYNDTAHTVFTSQPFVVAARTTWLDPNGATDYNGSMPGGTTVTLDAEGRTISTVDAISKTSTTSFTYGTSDVSTDTNKYAITTTIDGNGYEGKVSTNTLGQSIYTLTYSGFSTGTLTAIKRSTTTYNVLEKPTSIIITDLSPQSNQTINSVTTTATYDSLGRELSLADPDRGTHTSTYNANGNISTDTVGTRVIGTSYDLLGRIGCIQNQAAIVSVSGTCTSGATPYIVNTYDATPNTVTWNSTSYPIGKLTQSVAYNYYTADSATGLVTENYQYDQRGQVITSLLNIAISNGATLTFPAFPTNQKTQTYNDAGQSVTTTTTTGDTTNYTFTNVYDGTTGIQTGLTNGALPLASLSYNARALLNTITFMDSAGSSLAAKTLLYDGDLRPASSTTTWTNSGSTIHSDGVTYDAIGNVLSRATTQATMSTASGSGGSEVQNFCYDSQSQLVWASNAATGTASAGQTCGTAATNSPLGNSYTNNYTYTNLGQLWQSPLNGNGAQEQYLYCNASHPHQVTALSPRTGSPTCSSQGTTAYTASYDSYGNMATRVTDATTASTLTYNPLDQLQSWTGTTASASNEEWYLYDSSGNRVMRRSASTTSTGTPASSAATIMVYAFGLAEHTYTYTGSGTTATNSANNYYYTIAGQLIGAYNGNNTIFYLTDLLGSIVSAITNTPDSAAIVGETAYGPYGNVRYSAGSIGTSKGYTGQQGDGLTGLDYYNARYYDPVSSRFTSADTVQDNLKGYDPYAYVCGNPETKTDPTGHDNGPYVEYAIAWYRSLHPLDYTIDGNMLSGISILSSNHPNNVQPDIQNYSLGTDGVVWDFKTGSPWGAVEDLGNGFSLTRQGTMWPDPSTVASGSAKLAKYFNGTGIQLGDLNLDRALKSQPCITLACPVYFADGTIMLVGYSDTVSGNRPYIGLDKSTKGILQYSITQHHLAASASTQVISQQEYQQIYGTTQPQVGPKKQASTYTVRPGDTLSGIAMSLWGSYSQWRNLYSWNQGQISNYNLIFPGQVLTYH